MVSKTRVSISKTMSIVSSVQKVGVSISLRLSLTLAITIISKTVVSKTRVSISKTMSIVSTIQKVGVSISLGLGLGLSKGNSGQKGNSNSLQHLLASPCSDQQRIPM